MDQKTTTKVRTKSKKTTVKHKFKLMRPKSKKPETIVVDADLGLVFESESEVLKFFGPQINLLIKQYNDLEDKKELPIDKVTNLEELMEVALDDPDEVWMLPENSSWELNVFAFIRNHVDAGIYHILLAHVDAEDEPTFVYFHFLTRNTQVVERYRQGRMVYDQALSELEFGMIDGDSLSEGDPVAVGLFQAMLKVRGEADVTTEQFIAIGGECRDRTIEEADEIWKSQDSQGQILVTFIREFPDHVLVKDLTYIVVTQQEPESGVHALLFSFPTKDEQLVDRYRHGENLHAEEVAQESSH